MSIPPATTQPKHARGKYIAIVVVVVLIGAVFAAYYALGLGGPTGTTTPGESTSSGNPVVNIASGTGVNTSLNFDPQTITVVLGKNSTIVFTNNDVTEHTVSFFSGPTGVTLASISDANLAKGASYTVALTVAGTYYYKCFIHPWMFGKIIVDSS